MYMYLLTAGVLAVIATRRLIRNIHVASSPCYHFWHMPRFCTQPLCLMFML